MKILKHLSISPSGGLNIRRRYVRQQLRADTKAADKHPDIRMVITDYYKGAINDVIYMIVRNVDHVIVSILSAEGKEVEKGAAMNNSGVWSYRAGVANSVFLGGKVLITAGNIRGDWVEMGVALF